MIDPTLFLPFLQFAGQMLLSACLGILIGFQRERAGKPVGPRTYAFVAIGSTLFTLLSVSAFSQSDDRVAAQIISGIGFIGAGAILHKGDTVHGITTAAAFWATAAVGMAVGVGWYKEAMAVAALMFGLLVWNDKK